MEEGSSTAFAVAHSIIERRLFGDVHQLSSHCRKVFVSVVSVVSLSPSSDLVWRGVAAPGSCLLVADSPPTVGLLYGTRVALWAVLWERVQQD